MKSLVFPEDSESLIVKRGKEKGNCLWDSADCCNCRCNDIGSTELSVDNPVFIVFLCQEYFTTSLCWQNKQILGEDQ